MRLHAVVAVVGAQLQKLREILVPRIYVDRHRALPHAQLIHGNSSVVHQPDPADDAARRPLKAPNGAVGGPYLAIVQPHAAPKLGHLGKIVNGAVDAVQTVRHRVDKAAGKLVMGLSRVGHGGGGHGDLHAAEHIVKPPDPAHAVRGLIHGKVERDAQEHLLRRFQRLTAAGLDDVSLEQQVKAGIGEQRVPLRA